MSIFVIMSLIYEKRGELNDPEY
ncbi:hypothetical protein BN10_530024 [Phycicoccus elongatus Lp2]|uniref:Uncharacterized protein n=1 Tax=Phycicoccus elongatus Lp2 TaxID=1193181 RepID=N0DZZ3_9MICO|nr:hypothetical protein BN10_530024 [Phycicoccus elongatus Lp2]